MAIELTDIDDDDDMTPEATRGRIGCIVMSDDGSWIASCPALGPYQVGQGPFDGLPADVTWMVNRPYATVRALQEANPGINLKSDGWLRIGIDGMPSEWGIENLSSPGSIDSIARIMDRVYGVSIDAILKSGLSQYKQDTKLYSAIERSPSLSTGMRNIFNHVMDKTVPSDTKVRKRLSEAQSYGVTIPSAKNINDGEMLITCRIPSLSHAIRVTSHEVPGPGKWQKANFKDGTPFEAHVEDLKNTGLPIMVIANPKERDAQSDYLSKWVRPFEKSIKRISYTFEEVLELLPFYEFEDYSVIVGPGWRKPVTSKMISSLIASCGGRNVASSSWSVGVAAENILCGGFRKLGNSEAIAPECIWLTVADRIEMRASVELMADYGASLVSAYAGAMTFKAPKDPEILTMIVNAIWEAGMVMPVGMVRALAEMGVETPFAPEDFGGASEDIILSQLLHRAQRNAMWIFDEIQSLPSGQREKTFSETLG